MGEEVGTVRLRAPDYAGLRFSFKKFRFYFVAPVLIDEMPNQMCLRFTGKNVMMERVSVGKGSS